uniref:Putative cop protein n=1 Tax=Staphylococcus staphylolyticus TaxID=1287 RepID=F1BYR8_STAST|nr:putative cop protein [Staphylococcus simulans bv. staphylolyticus]
MSLNKFLKHLISLFFLSILIHDISHKTTLFFYKTMPIKSCFFSFPVKFLIRHLKLYYTRYEKATFFVFKHSNTKGSKVFNAACNSYP